MFYQIAFYKKQNKWQKLLLIKLFLTISVFCAGKAIASSVQDYCLSKAKPSEFKMELDKYSTEQSEIWLTQTEKFNFSRNNKNYSLKKDYKTIQLIEENKGIISQLEIPFKKDSWIRVGYLTKDNWLYITASKSNYAAKIDLDNPSSFLRYKRLPNIYSEQCNKFTNWFDGGCSVEGFSYHSSSNKVFLTGNQSISGKKKWVVIEVAAGETKILNTSKQIESISHIPELGGFILQGVEGEILFYDGVEVNEIKTPKPVDRILKYISKLNGVLLQGTAGEVLFYNGANIKEIPANFPKQSRKMRDWYLAEITAFESENQNNADERIFLTNFKEGAKAPHLFMELKADLSLEPIPFPKNKNKTEITLVQFSDDSRLWAMLYGDSILA